MTEVRVPYGENPSETATLLLAAAEELDLDPGVVGTTSDQVFRVPEEVAVQAGVHTGNSQRDAEASSPASEEPAGGEQSPEAEGASGDESPAYDPGEPGRTVDDVKDYVEANPDQAEAVLAAEREGKARSTLVAWLEDAAAENGSE